MSIDSPIQPGSQPFHPISQGGEITQNLQKEHEAGQKQEETFIKDHSILHQPIADPPLDADVGFLHHLLGDALGGHQELPRGNAQNTPLGHTIDFLQRALKKMESKDPSFAFLTEHKEKIEGLLKNYEEAKKIEDKISEIGLAGRFATKEERTRLVKEYAGQLQKQFSEKPGWFPGGWASSPKDNHEVMIHIDTKKGLKIVNTGEGLETYHKSTRDASIDPLTGQLKEETLVQEFVDVTGCRKERIESVEFYQALLELKLAAAWDPTIKAGPQELYEGVVGYLGGKIKEAENPNADSAVYKKAPRGQTDAVKGITASLYYTLIKDDGKSSKSGLNCFKQLKFQWQYETLVAVAKKLLLSDPPIPLNHDERSRLRDMCENLARSVAKLESKHLLTGEQLQSFQATILDIQRRMDLLAMTEEVPVDIEPSSISTQADPAKLRKGDITTEPLFGIEDHEQLLEDALSGNSKPVQAGMSGQRSILPANQQQRFPKIDPHVSILFQIKVPEQLSAENLVQVVDEFSQRIKPVPIYIGASKALALSCLSDFLLALPVPVKGNDIWSEIPPDKIVPTMEKISLLLERCINCREGSHPTPEETVMQYTLLTILDKLARQIPESRLQGFNLNYYELLVAVKQENFALPSVKMHEHCFSVLRYFDPEFTLEETTKPINREDFDSQFPTLFSFKQHASNRPQSPAYIMSGLRLAEDNIEESQTFQFFSRFVDHESLRYVNPRLAKLAKLMASRSDSGLLPEPVHLLLNAAINIVKIHTKDPTPYSFAFISRVTEWQEYRCTASQEIHIDGRRDDTWYLNFGLSQSRLPKPGPARDFDDRRTVEERQSEQSFHYSRMEQNRIMQQPPPPESLGLSADQFRELRMTATDPFDELNRIVSFCVGHPQLLKGNFVKNMFVHSPFKLGRVLSQIEDNPAFAGRLADSFTKMLTNYSDNRDLESYEIVVKVGKQLAQFFSEKKIVADPPFPDFDALMWQDWILKKRDDKDSQSIGSDPKALENIKLLLTPDSIRPAEEYTNDPKLLAAVSKNYFAAVILSSLQSKSEDSLICIT